jgi:hypothetical protein
VAAAIVLEVEYDENRIDTLNEVARAAREAISETSLLDIEFRSPDRVRRPRGPGTHSVIQALFASSAIGSPDVIPSIQIRLTPSAETALVDRFLSQDGVGEARKARLGDPSLWLALHTEEHRLARLGHPPTTAMQVAARRDWHRRSSYRSASHV